MAGFFTIPSPEHLLYLMVVSIAVAFVVAWLLFILTIVHKVLVESRLRTRMHTEERYRTALRRMLEDGTYAIERPRRPIEFEALGEVIASMAGHTTDRDELILQECARGLGVMDYFLRRARRGSWLRRMTALEKLGFFRLPEVRLFYHGLLRAEKNRDILARAVLSLSFVAEDEGDLKSINRVLKNPFFKSAKFKEYVYVNIIRSFREKGRENLLLRYLSELKNDPSVPLLLKKDILEACGSEAFERAKYIIMEYLSYFAETAEIRIVCVRALGRLGGRDVCSTISHCLYDEDWRVRAVAAKTAFHCSGDIIPHLRKCLRDANYYVRLNAAAALSKFGSPGLSVLRQEVLSDDRFTRDVSAYMLKACRAADDAGSAQAIAAHEAREACARG